MDRLNRKVWVVRWILRRITDIAQRVFRPKIYIYGTPHLEGGVMVLPSHPNHLDDVLVTQRVWGARDDIFFIGTSEMMLAPEGASLLTRVKTGLQGFLLQSAGFVPAHRAKDGRGGKSFQMANRATAEEFGKLIADGHIGVIFPGGGEELPPHRKAEKQGSMAGRIALAAEEAAGVAGKITYQIARIFPSNTRYPWKSTVTVRLSEPFTSETFVEAGLRNPLFDEFLRS